MMIDIETVPAGEQIEQDCEDCGGSGFDPGGVDPWGPEPCPGCHGAKTRLVTRNYLAEALRICTDPETARPINRAHLMAVMALTNPHAEL